MNLNLLSAQEQRTLALIYRFIVEDKRTPQVEDVYCHFNGMEYQEAQTTLDSLLMRQAIEMDEFGNVVAILTTQHLTPLQHNVLVTAVSCLDSFGRVTFDTLMGNLRNIDGIHPEHIRSQLDELTKQGFLTKTDLYTVYSSFGRKATNQEIVAALHADVIDLLARQQYAECIILIREILSLVEGDGDGNP